MNDDGVRPWASCIVGFEILTLVWLLGCGYEFGWRFENHWPHLSHVGLAAWTVDNLVWRA